MDEEGWHISDGMILHQAGSATVTMLMLLQRKKAYSHANGPHYTYLFDRVFEVRWYEQAVDGVDAHGPKRRREVVEGEV